ncbi:MAG TPA: hypothetical protein DCX25_03930 [Candidatus Pacebacteria bacterium]|nr:MAG: Family 2 glycosyl transferase [Microgenomates group bacterium GW2011_GWB1_45_17]KKU24809.1 MAG: Family 2 glycosyl transferase [Microgenomates group bacterium GW2011_GWC1_46_15]HAV15455.1 hypothetical protein [Candidatus Paceibacterota bacterium]HCR11486.1 hypothetical protein [Candidatus Paceibacterota bacterium]HCR92965.1 hypothetical protein [Candidatus Paceibacterota bacterium]
MKFPPLSLVIHTKNVASTLMKTLESVKNLADEIIIVDMQSTDNTVALAKQYTKSIFSYKDIGYADPARNFGLSKAHHPWILVLDADEYLEPETCSFIQSILMGKVPEALLGDCYYFPRKNIIWGDWVKYAGWWPDYQLRLFKQGHAEWGGKVHKNPKPMGKTVFLPPQLKYAIVHANYNTVEEFVSRMNRYTTLEQEQSPKKHITSEVLINSFFSEFERRLLGLNGIDGGLRGVGLSLLQGMYNMLITIKQAEREGFPEEKDTAQQVSAGLRTMRKKLRFWRAHYLMTHSRFPLNIYWRIQRKLHS